MNILIAGLYEPGSALTAVMTRLALHMAGRASVTLLGFDPRPGAPRNVEIDGMPTHVVWARGGRMIAEAGWLDNLMARDAAPDVCIVTGPVRMARSLIRQLTQFRPRVRLVYYVPTEGSIVVPAILDILAMTDDCVLYTDSARRDLLTLASASKDPTLPRLHVVGHGVDKQDFWDSGLRGDLSARHLVRQSFWETNDPEELVILNANRPYFRKRLDLTIAGFGDFAKLHPRCRLVLHTGATSKAQRIELATSISSSGAPDKIAVLSVDAPMTVERLNQLYNVCDVGLTTSMGEGWGLTTFEHAATGAPQVVPDHTSFSENWRGAASMLRTEQDIAVFYEYAEMHATTPWHVASALHTLVADVDHMRRMGKLAKVRADDPKFCWDRVCARFFSILASGGQPSPLVTPNIRASTLDGNYSCSFG